MARSLAPCFTRVLFPVPIPMRDLLELVTWAIEQGKGFGSSFDGARFAPARPIGELILGNDFQQLSDELFLLLARAGLRDGDTELTHGIHGAFETEPFHRHLPEVAGLH